VDDQPTSAIIQETRQEFERLIPEIPYIGGKANNLTQDLIDCTMLLALYQVLKREGFRIEEIGKIVIEMEQKRVHSYPRFVLKLLSARRGRVHTISLPVRLCAAERYAGRLFPFDDTG
jgi:hypothetical protein